ncbi:HD-GYP domain-containing protein [Magnetospirillum sp. SS-4]|uniref:HD-GYP domain-containing protein n=1 Tax=Magnetospirillum sp. SS-4 TaxID=2681465 RepID=UPI00137EF14C|nr:HD domain-containing phosphohydrolase [Magnetospirillum sp. SS-4]CAA7625065.1 Response regulator receiver modulated metal dependent phosphohydrolase [Magnetospirillum sp. SS-4]
MIATGSAPATNIQALGNGTVLVAGHADVAAALRRRGVRVAEATCFRGAAESLWADPAISIIAASADLPGGGGGRLVDTARSALGRDIEAVLLSPSAVEPEAVFAVMKAVRRQAPPPGEETPSAGTGGEVEKLFECLAVAAEHKDNETGRHNRRIGCYTGVLAKALRWRPEQCRTIELAASLHDIGKIGIPDDILFKRSPLTPDERIRMEHHTIAGYQILSAASSPVLGCAANIARHHHERWCGGGYPFGLRGAMIPIEARIVAVCDVYDALRSARPYKSGLTHAEALRAMLKGDERTSADHFDPDVLEAFQKVEPSFDGIFTMMMGD